MNFINFIKKFDSEKKCIEYFIDVNFDGKVICPFCGGEKVYQKKDRVKIFDCGNCGKSFSIFKNTIFENSSTDLVKWFYAIHLILNSKKGFSAKQMERELGVTYKTAWRMLKQIRSVMGRMNFAEQFENIVEIDETYIGGRKRHTSSPLCEKSKSQRGRGTTKIPVIGVKDRDTKQVFAKVATFDEYGRKLSGSQLRAVLDSVCKEGTTVVSDDFKGYSILDHEHSNPKKFNHITVNHSIGLFSAGDDIHTNGIEGFWATVKRSMYGVYHHVSKKYLQSYIDECCFHQNHKDNKNVFDDFLKMCVA